MQHEVESFIEFCKKKVSFFFIALTIVLSYGLLYGKGAVGIDDESVEYYLEEGLIALDRVGWNLTNRIFQSYAFLPWWTSLLGILFFTFGILIWIYGIDKKLDRIFSKKIISMAVAVMISYPYIAKFAIFSGNMAAIGYVICFTAVALYASYCLIDEIKVKYFVVITVCLCGVFLFEKAYITFFFQGMAAFIFLKRKDRDHISMLVIVKWVVFLCVSVIVSFLASKLVILSIQAYMGITPSSYTSNYFSYDLSSFSGFLSSFQNFIENYIILVKERMGLYFGEKIYVSAIFVILAMSFFFSIKRQDFLLFLFGMVNIVLSGSVFLATGNIYMPIRSFCFNYIFLIGTCVLYAASNVVINRKLEWICCIIGIVIIGNQSREMEEVYYKKFLSYEKDKIMSQKILSDIEKECGILTTYQKPIIFMGFPDNSNLNYGEVEECSEFIWDRNASIDQEETSVRIYRFYQELGYKLVPPDDRIDFYQIRKEVANMQPYPREGYICEKEEYVIVKLGSSLCEILSEKEYKPNLNEELLGNIEVFSCENRKISISGWLADKGKCSYGNIASLVLSNDKNKYRLRMEHMDRQDVTDYISDGINYDNSGFYAELLCPDYIQPGSYKVYIELRNKNDVSLYQVVENIDLQ